MGWRESTEFLVRRGGVARIVDVAAAGGLAPSTVRRRARREGMPLPLPGVVALPGVPLDGRLRALAALAWAGPPSALTRWSALHHLGVWRTAPSRPQLLVPATRCGDADGRVELLRTRSWRPQDVTGAPACVTPARAICDLAAVVDAAVLRDRVIDLVQRRQLTVTALAEHLATAPRFVGVARVREVVAQLGDAGRTDAPLELEVRRRLRRAGVPLDRGQVPVACTDGVVRHLDLGVARWRFGVEVDSMLAHSTRSQLEADVRRSNGLALACDPWRLLRLTWRDLEPDRWPAFLAQVRRALALQRAIWDR